MLEAAATSVAPPERRPRSPTASVLPPVPTMVGTRVRIPREPEITAKKTDIGKSDGSSETTDNDNTEDDSNSKSGSEFNKEEDSEDWDSDEAKTKYLIPVLHDSKIRIGPPTRKARCQHSKPSMTHPTTAFEASLAPDDGTYLSLYFHFIYTIISSNIDVIMNSPPCSGLSQVAMGVHRGRPTDIKDLSPPRPSGASRPYGGVFRAHALGNAPNMADREPVNPTEPILVQGKVNYFVTKDPPSTVDVDTLSLTAILSPCYPTLRPLLERVARRYSPVRSKLFTSSRIFAATYNHG